MAQCRVLRHVLSIKDTNCPPTPAKAASLASLVSIRYLKQLQNAMVDTKTMASQSEHASLPVKPGAVQEAVIAESYEYWRNLSLLKRVWHHSLTQMILLSIQAFCGPAMSDAIAGTLYYEPITTFSPSFYIGKYTEAC